MKIIGEYKLMNSKEIDDNNLMDFYKNNYIKRYNFLKKYYKWYYRKDIKNNNSPHIIMHDNKIISHGGLRIHEGIFNDRQIDISFILDLIVDDNYKRRGLATLIEQSLITYSNITFGFPNKKASGIYKKIGYCVSNNAFMHYFIINPSFFLKNNYLIISNFLDYLYNIKFLCFFRKYKKYIKYLIMESIDEENIKKFETKINIEKKIIRINHNFDFFKWRLLESPEKNKYKIAFLHGYEENMVILKLEKKLNYIDLFTMGNHNQIENNVKLISTLILWAKSNDYSCIRYFTTNQSLSEKIKKRLYSYVTTHEMVYINKGNNTNLITNDIWELELIDGDFEAFE